MASTVLGTALPFGAPTVTGLVVQSASFDEIRSIAEVADEDGDFVSAAIYAPKITGTIEGVNNSEALAINDALSVTGAPAGTYYITAKGLRLGNTDFQRVTISLTSWGGISA